MPGDDDAERELAACALAELCTGSLIGSACRSSLSPAPLDHPPNPRHNARPDPRAIHVPQHVSLAGPHLSAPVFAYEQPAQRVSPVAPWTRQAAAPLPGPSRSVPGKRKGLDTVQPEQAAQLAAAAALVRHLPPPVARLQLAKLTGLTIGLVDRFMLEMAASRASASTSAASARATEAPCARSSQPCCSPSPPDAPESMGAAVGVSPSRPAQARQQQLLLAMAFARDPDPPSSVKQALAAAASMRVEEIERWLSCRRTLKSKLQRKIDE